MNLVSTLDLYGGGPGSGCHGDNCGRKPKGTSDRAHRAKSTHIPATRKVHKAALANQTRLAKHIEGQEIADNKPFDVVYKDIGIEVKTLINQTNSKLTMHPSSLARKLREAKQTKLRKVFTVAFDKRPGKNDIYVREGLGSFRLGAMIKVKDMDELKRIITRA